MKVCGGAMKIISDRRPPQAASGANTGFACTRSALGLMATGSADPAKTMEENMPVVDPRIAGKPVPRISKATMERDCVARVKDVKALDVACLDRQRRGAAPTRDRGGVHPGEGALAAVLAGGRGGAHARSRRR